MCLYNWVNYFLIIHLLILDFFLYQPFQKNSWGGARSCSRLVNSLFNQGCMRTGASTSPTPSLQGSAVQNPHHTVSLLHLPCSLLLSPRPLQLLSWTHSPGFTFSLLVFGEWILCLRPLYPSCYCKQRLVGYTLPGMLPTLENCWPCPRVTVMVCIPGIFQTLWNLTALGSPSSHTCLSGPSSLQSWNLQGFKNFHSSDNFSVLSKRRKKRHHCFLLLF